MKLEILRDYKFKFLLGVAQKIEKNKYQIDLNGVVLGLVVTKDKINVYANNPYELYRSRIFRKLIVQNNPLVLRKILRKFKTAEDFYNSFLEGQIIKEVRHIYTKLADTPNKGKKIIINSIKKAYYELLNIINDRDK